MSGVALGEVWCVCENEGACCARGQSSGAWAGRAGPRERGQGKKKGMAAAGVSDPNRRCRVTVAR